MTDQVRTWFHFRWEWWHSGELLADFDWATNEPDSVQPGSSIALSCNSDFQWVSHANSFAVEASYICELPLCPTNYDKDGETCYQVEKQQPKTMFEATLSCVSTGGKLVEPRSFTEIAALKTYLTQNHGDCSQWVNPGSWIGARMTADLVWRWVSDRTEVEAFDWNTNHPLYEEEGAVLYLGCPDNFSWFDDPSSIARFNLTYVCQADLLR